MVAGVAASAGKTGELVVVLANSTVDEEAPKSLSDVTDALEAHLATLSGATALNEFAEKFVAGDDAVALTDTVTLKLIAGTNQSGR